MTAPHASFPRGAEWCIWDLHVHTPSSVVQNYGADNDETWERFLSELEALPKEIRVLGINDYWFLDGYKRVVKARTEGRLRNIVAVFPVVELRIPQFGGTEGHLSRVNLHVIFDPDIPVEVIEQQFLGALGGKFSLVAGTKDATWSGAVTRDSVIELGRQVKASAPEDKKDDYKSDLIEGFNNLNVPLENVKDVLESSFLKGRTLVGLGKAEWNQIKWNDGSIATKKDVINYADLIFTAFHNPSDWPDHIAKLRSAGVNSRLLDCSDSHQFSSSDQPERLGQCRTWMNTTPTFAGLVHALEEFDYRIYVGLAPPILGRVQRHPEQFIDSVRIFPTADDIAAPTFDYELSLNAGFVAIVGNKGQGKSALLDCIALAGNSARNGEFAFLTSQRFLSAGNKRAKDYAVEVKWTAGPSRKAQLNEQYDSSSAVAVEYLPQKFVERVCSADDLSDDADAFEKELREVLFTHISDEERAGAESFDALLEQCTRSSFNAIERLRAELRPLIKAYVDLAEFRASNSLEDVDAKLRIKRSEIEIAEGERNEAVAALSALDEASESNSELDDLRAESGRYAGLRTALSDDRSTVERKLADLRRKRLAMESVLQRGESIQADVVNLNSEADDLLADGSEVPNSLLFSFEIDRSRYDSWNAATSAEMREHHAALARIDERVFDLGQRSAESDARLAELDSTRELARQRVIQADQRLSSLRGDIGDPESEAGLAALRQAVASSPDRSDEVRQEMLRCVAHIHAALVDQVESVGDLYSPAAAFISDSEVVSRAGLEFNAELRVLPQWNSIGANIDLRRSPELSTWMSGFPDRVEVADWSEIEPELDLVMLRLERERGDDQGVYRNPASALRSTISFGDFLTRLLDLSWMEVRFGLTGDGQPLSQLSPGQRGLVLALFYLIVDQRTTPLLLDQPEENLDNETIASLLVPAIREAAGRRQTIVVTHNANLAVVGNADQIIHCRAQDRRFYVSSGCISELGVARIAVTILEGTKPAFDNRRQKYEVFPAL